MMMLLLLLFTFVILDTLTDLRLSTFVILLENLLLYLL
jgi:hypothetical protein